MKTKNNSLAKKSWVITLALIFILQTHATANQSQNTTANENAPLASTSDVSGVKEGYDNAKSNNNGGIIQSLAGMASHMAMGAGLMNAFNGTCGSPSGCVMPILAAALFQFMQGGKAGSQAGAHGASNFALNPDLCKVTAGTCSDYPNFGECKSTDMQCLINKSNQISDISIPDDVTNSLQKMKDACQGNATCLAAIPDANGDFMFNGKKMNTKSFNAATDFKNQLGMTDAQLAEQAAKDLLADENAKKLAAKFVVKNLSGGGGGFNGFGDMAAGAPQQLASPDATQVNAAAAKREPANLAGLNKKFRGELIGIAMDDIFSMMNRRYKLKDEQNSFMESSNK